MFVDTPENLIYLVGGAFLLGWFVGKVAAYFGGRFRAGKRDPRDDRIRSMDAELRIAQSEAGKAKEEVEQLKKDIEEEHGFNAQKTLKITELEEKIEKLKADLRESVKKTRELRGELSDRAAENVKSEVRLREVQTELSVAQASTDLLATGVLDYSVAPEGEEEKKEDGEPSDAVKAAR